MKWEMLAAWLHAQWVATDHEVFPLHRGIFEGYSTCADVIAKCPPEWTAEQRLERLFEALNEALTCTESPEDADDE